MAVDNIRCSLVLAEHMTATHALPKVSRKSKAGDFSFTTKQELESETKSGSEQMSNMKAARLAVRH